MARLKGKLYKGVVGNTVLKGYRGEQLLIIKADTPIAHMTEGTRKAAWEFGKASNLAASIRWSLGAVIANFNDGTAVSRLNAEVLYCLNAARDPQTDEYQYHIDSFGTLAGFEFNINSKMRANFFAAPQVSLNENTLEIRLPELYIPRDIKFPKNVVYCKFIITVGMIDLINRRLSALPSQSVEIPYSYNAVTLPAHTFSFEPEPGCLCVTGFTLHYYEKTFAGVFLVNSKSFSPTAILNAQIMDGNVDPERTKDWMDMAVAGKKK